MTPEGLIPLSIDYAANREPKHSDDRVEPNGDIRKGGEDTE